MKQHSYRDSLQNNEQTYSPALLGRPGDPRQFFGVSEPNSNITQVQIPFTMESMHCLRIFPLLFWTGVCVYSWPLNNRVWIVWFKHMLYVDFLKINIQSAFHFPGFWICRFNQPQMEKSIFDLWLGLQWMQTANCMHCSMPFYTRDLDILGVWYLRGWGGIGMWGWGGVLEPVPVESKVIHRFSIRDEGGGYVILVMVAWLSRFI